MVRAGGRRCVDDGAVRAFGGDLPSSLSCALAFSLYATPRLSGTPWCLSFTSQRAGQRKGNLSASGAGSEESAWCRWDCLLHSCWKRDAWRVCSVADMADVSGGEGGAGVPTTSVAVELGKRLADAPLLTNISSLPTDTLMQPPPPPTEAQLTAENVVLREQLTAFRAAARVEMSSFGFDRQPPPSPATTSSDAADPRARDCAQWAAAIAKQYYAARVCGLRLLSAADLANLHAALARATTSERLLNMAATLPESVRHAIFINVFPQEPHSWILGFLMAEATLEMDDSGSAGSVATAPSVDDIVRHTDLMHPGKLTTLDIRAIFQQAFNSVTPARVSSSHGQPPQKNCCKIRS